MTGSKIFPYMTTFWASRLPMAKYVWNWSSEGQPDGYYSSFRSLQFLHHDYCPRVILVLPLYKYMALPELETLEIVCCGDLREIFPLNPRPEKQEIVKHFPRLRRIHLHNLPMLHSICGRMMSAPMLETLIVTGCPALRRVPAVGGRLAQPPTVVCEKDWWDGLKWVGLEAKHHPSLFHPRHSRHYRKAKLLRGTVLRLGDRSSNIIIACSRIHSFIPCCSVGIYVTHLLITLLTNLLYMLQVINHQPPLVDNNHMEMDGPLHSLYMLQVASHRHPMLTTADQIRRTPSNKLLIVIVLFVMWLVSSASTALLFCVLCINIITTGLLSTPSHAVSSLRKINMYFM